jgi:hypothetical protein
MGGLEYAALQNGWGEMTAILQRMNEKVSAGGKR